MITLDEFMLFWLGCALAVQLIYIWFVFGRLAFYKEESKGNIDLPPVSIIVAARNEYENLQKLIPALMKQNYVDYEVIIIDDRSFDESYDYLLKAQAEHPNLTIRHINETPEHINAKKFALTMGIKAAKNEHLLFTDADCLPTSEDWIREMASRYTEKKEFVIGFSQYEKRKGLLNAFIRFETFWVGVQYLSFALWGRPYMGVGRNLSYKKEVFFRHKGFLKHKHITGGDDDLFVNMAANKRNSAISINEWGQTTSIPKTSWKDWYYQKIRHLSVGKRYKSGDVFFLGLWAISHIGFFFLLLLSYFAKVSYIWLLGAYFLRQISLMLIFYLVKRKMNRDFEWYLLPFMDILYIFYYIFVGVAARSTNKIAWRR